MNEFEQHLLNWRNTGFTCRRWSGMQLRTVCRLTSYALCFYNCWSCMYSCCCRCADEIHERTGWDVPIHVDAAAGGFVAPFIHQDLEWDFRLPRVISINASGHKCVTTSGAQLYVEGTKLHTSNLRGAWNPNLRHSRQSVLLTTGFARQCTTMLDPTVGPDVNHAHRCGIRPCSPHA